MDDDEGLVLNIAPAIQGELATVKKERAKWRSNQRQSGKTNDKQNHHLSHTRIPYTPSNATPLATTEERPSKKRKVNSATHEQSNTSIKRGRPVISSLFTFNPEIPSSDLANRANEPTNPLPSNAPVADSSSFIGLGIDKNLVEHLKKKLHIETPTLVQQKAIPAILGAARRVQGAAPISDTDIFIQAETGSGKTLSFLLPIIHRMYTALDKDPGRHVGTLAIILTPTRELSRQIYDVLTILQSVPASLERPHWMVPGIVMGGDRKKSEKARLRKGVHILVSTPGRLLDHLQNSRAFQVSNLRWLVLDEADRLMDLGLEETLRQIISILNQKGKPVDGRHILDRTTILPRRRLTVLCSATLRDDVEKLAGEALNKPTMIRAQDQKKEDVFEAPKQLRQRYCISPAKLRLVTLTALLSTFLSNKPNSKAIVFFSCTDAVDFYHSIFTPKDNDDEGIGASEDDDDGEKKKDSQVSARSKYLANFPTMFKLHGNMNQDLRTSTFYAFSKLNAGAVLFCTDVAARGLDMADVGLIIQYDAPGTVNDYVHRIGRTARLGKEGEAVLMLLPSEIGYLNVLKDIGDLHEQKLQDVLAAGFRSHQKAGYEMKATELQLAFERWVLSSEDHLNIARKAFKSHIRAYATHVASEKIYFHIKLLHLGHVAKAFALRDAPSDINISKGHKTDERETFETKQKTEQRIRIRKKQAENIVGEFGGDIVTRPARKRKR